MIAEVQTTRPAPTGWLIALSAVWMTLFAAGAGWAAWYFAAHEFDSLLTLAAGPALALAGLALIFAQWAAVYRQQRGCAAVLTVFYFLLSGFSGLPFFLVVMFIGSGQITSAMGIVATISLLAPAITLLMAAQMMRWTRKLEDHIQRLPLCERCGYNLLGSIRGGQRRCPECGAAIPPQKVAIYRPSEDSTADATHSN